MPMSWPPSEGSVISTGSGVGGQLGGQERRRRERGPTLGPRLQLAVLLDLKVVGQLANHAAVFLVHQHNLAALAAAHGAVAPPRVRLAGHVVGGVVRRQVLRDLALARRRGRALFAARLGRRGALEEGGALRQDGLKRVDVLLDALAALDAGELDARESAAVRAQVPARDEVAARRLVVDLRGGGQREVQLGRQVQVQVKVLLGVGAVGVEGRVGKGGRGRHHEQRQRLRAGGRQRLLLAVGDVVGRDVLDGVEELWVLVREGVLVVVVVVACVCVCLLHCDLPPS